MDAETGHEFEHLCALAEIEQDQDTFPEIYEAWFVSSTGNTSA